MPRLRGGLQVVIERHGGVLMVDEQVQNFGAEAREEERYERETP